MQPVDNTAVANVQHTNVESNPTTVIVHLDQTCAMNHALDSDDSKRNTANTIEKGDDAACRSLPLLVLSYMYIAVSVKHRSGVCLICLSRISSPHTHTDSPGACTRRGQRTFQSDGSIDCLGQYTYFLVFLAHAASSLRSVHITHVISSDLISTDLIPSEASGCEAIQYAVAVTNQTRRRDLRDLDCSQPRRMNHFTGHPLRLS